MSCLVGLGKERDEEQIQSMLPLWCPGAKSRTMGAIRAGLGPYQSVARQRSGVRLSCQSWELGPGVENIKLRVCDSRSEWSV